MAATLSRLLIFEAHIGIPLSIHGFAATVD
jgi:hypothetical protein